MEGEISNGFDFLSGLNTSGHVKFQGQHFYGVGSTSLGTLTMLGTSDVDQKKPTLEHLIKHTTCFVG